MDLYSKSREGQSRFINPKKTFKRQEGLTMKYFGIPEGGASYPYRLYKLSELYMHYSDFDKLVCESSCVCSLKGLSFDHIITELNKIWDRIDNSKIKVKIDQIRSKFKSCEELYHESERDCIEPIATQMQCGWRMVTHGNHRILAMGLEGVGELWALDLTRPAASEHQLH